MSARTVLYRHDLPPRPHNDDPYAPSRATSCTLRAPGGRYGMDGFAIEREDEAYWAEDARAACSSGRRRTTGEAGWWR